MTALLRAETPDTDAARADAPAVTDPAVADTGGWIWPARSDPRWPFAAVLLTFCVLGFTVWGFNRSPWQMLAIIAAGTALDFVATYIVTRKKIVPLSGMISCTSLAIILNYAHDSLVLLLPVLLTIGSKHLFRVSGRHVFNPSMFGVAVSLLISRDLITAAPAYQWFGNSMVLSVVLIAVAMLLFVRRVNRLWLVGSFLVFYALNTAIRAYIMRHHLPPDMLFIGTMTTPPFFLFVFYMLTDPKTSPDSVKGQIGAAAAIATIDLALHAKESVYTFFYAALIFATTRFVFMHAKAAWQNGPRTRLLALRSPMTQRGLAVAAALAVVYGAIAASAEPPARREDPGFRYTPVPLNNAGIAADMSQLLAEVDPRVAHIAKWTMSVGDAVATADVNQDGRMDLFLTHPLKKPGQRAALYVQGAPAPDGTWQYERVPLPALDAIAHNPKQHGMVAGATFADYDNDGDLDLALAVGWGKSRLLKNMLSETGELAFEDVSGAVGFDEHTVSIAITFLDIERDGDLDMLVTNILTPYLPDYDPPRPFNFFDLPQPEYEGDRRMFHFMHNGWHDADNGGPTVVYMNDGDGTFTRHDGAAFGMDETRWTQAVATVDLNHDGFTDLYLANDFGPDEVYLNQKGTRFVKIRGRMFGDIGHDTYKGMNASLLDADNNGYLDVYVSNVHHALQAEGSLLWMVGPNPKDAFVPTFADDAAGRGALNERRFGWGAQAGDINNDGWADIVQANGMVGDALDPMGYERKDYWYVSHKLMQSGPEIHTYADKWGDIRGRTIYPDESARAYLNLAGKKPGHFVDVASVLGLDKRDNARGVLLSDIDDDGDLDTVITNMHSATDLYRSDLADRKRQNGRALSVQLLGDGDRTAKTPVGTRVELRAEGLPTQVREVTLWGGFASGQDPRLFFGLGSHEGPVTLVVHWLAAAPETFTLNPGHRVVIEHGKGVVSTQPFTAPAQTPGRLAPRPSEAAP